MSKRRARPRERTRDVRPTALVRGDERLGPPVTIEVTLRMREWEAFIIRLPAGLQGQVRDAFTRMADKMDAEIAELNAQIKPLEAAIATNETALADVDRQLMEATT